MRESPKLTPTNEGLDPKPYPQYPATLTRDTAKTFVSEYERAYRHNEFLTDWFLNGTDTVIIEIYWKYIEDWDSGFIIGVEGMVMTEDNHTPEGKTVYPETITRAPSADIPFAAWYLLTSRSARRRDLGREEFPENSAPPDMADAPCITCN